MIRYMIHYLPKTSYSLNLITPKGSFKIKEILYRADKIKNLKSKLQKKNY